MSKEVIFFLIEKDQSISSCKINNRREQERKTQKGTIRLTKNNWKLTTENPSL